MHTQRRKSRATRLSGRLAILVAIFGVTTILASGQTLTHEDVSEFPQSSYDQPHSSSLLTPLKSQRIERPYNPITYTERLHWFISGTIGPAHLAGVTFVSACGTAVNRPREYGPHWEGFANRFGIGMAGSATSNAMEAGAGLILREDPRYFRVPQQAFKFRVGNVARLTFLARNESGRSEPAYARYIGIVGSNFLSNTWRVHSEANVKDAVLRSSEGFAGCMAANAFKEFWPDVKRHVFHKYTRSSNLGTQVQARIPR
jgi:hypothetical protein